MSEVVIVDLPLAEELQCGRGGATEMRPGCTMTCSSHNWCFNAAVAEPRK